MTHPTSVRAFWRTLALLIVMGTTIGCDRVTKHLATSTLAEADRQSFLADTVRLDYMENTGAFLSLGATWPPAIRTAVFTVGNGVLIAAVVIFAFRRRWSSAALVGAGLFLGGALSNLVDRIAHGSVVDFINVGIGPLRTGIFNVADVAIFAGAILVAARGHESMRGRTWPD